MYVLQYLSLRVPGPFNLCLLETRATDYSRASSKCPNVSFVFFKTIFSSQAPLHGSRARAIAREQGLGHFSLRLRDTGHGLML